MRKRAIKILLALAVMVATFVIVTVVASAANYVEGDNDRDGYLYCPGDRCASGDQIVYMLYPSSPLDYSHCFFEDLCSSAPDSMYLYYCGGRYGDTEDTVFYPDDGYQDMMGYDDITVYYDTGEYFHVQFVNSYSDVPGYGSGGSGDSGDPDPQPDPPSTSSSFLYLTTMDGTPYIYCPDLAYRSYLQLVNRFLPVFYVETNVEYHDFMYELYYYARELGLSDIYNIHHIDEMEMYMSDATTTMLYEIENGREVRSNEGQIYEGLKLTSEGTYIFSLCFACNCSECGKYYSEFWFCLYALDSLPHLVEPDGSISTGTVTGGYADGYSKGYDEGREFGYNEAYADAEYFVGQRKYNEGYSDGYASGLDDGFSNGYETASYLLESDGSARYQQGYQDALEVVIDTDGDAISGLFVGISGSTINALDYITKNIRIGSSTLFDVIEFVLFVLFCYFVVKFVIKIFTK